MWAVYAVVIIGVILLLESLIFAPEKWKRGGIKNGRKSGKKSESRRGN